MKIAVFEMREDEQAKMEQLALQYDLSLATTGEVLCERTLSLAAGCEGVTTLGQSLLDGPMLELLKAQGVRFVSTRTIGYNHIDIAHAKQIGLKVCNASYAPNGVADFTIMLMLLVLRSYKPAMWRQQVNDYSLGGLIGKELHNQTVGVIGAGKIGAEVIRLLHAFGCPVLIYARHEREALRQYGRFVDLETLFQQSDIISLHVPLSADTRYLINSGTISRMKDGVILINTARGELMDIQALISGIENKKIGALGLDVFEHEQGIYHADRKTDIIKNRDMAYLRQFPNVVMTQHMAFYTDAGIESMVTCGIEGLVSFAQNGSYAHELTI